MKLSRPALLKTRAYVNGQWIGGDGGKSLDVLNPATGEIVASIADLGAAETERAIDAAAAATRPRTWPSARNGRWRDA